MKMPDTLGGDIFAILCCGALSFLCGTVLPLCWYIGLLFSGAL